MWATNVWGLPVGMGEGLMGVGGISTCWKGSRGVVAANSGEHISRWRKELGG